MPDPVVDVTSPILAFVPTSTNQGYWILLEDGAVFAFGDAVYKGRVVVKDA